MVITHSFKWNAAFQLEMCRTLIGDMAIKQWTHAKKNQNTIKKNSGQWFLGFFKLQCNIHHDEEHFSQNLEMSMAFEPSKRVQNKSNLIFQQSELTTKK